MGGLYFWLDGYEVAYPFEMVTPHVMVTTRLSTPTVVPSPPIPVAQLQEKADAVGQGSYDATTVAAACGEALGVLVNVTPP